MAAQKSYSQQFHEGVAHLGGASIGKAEDCFVGIIERYLKNPEAVTKADKKTVAETFYMLGNLANKAFNFQEALADFGIAKDLGFAADGLDLKIAWLHLRLGDIEGAEQVCGAVADKKTVDHCLGEIALARQDFKMAKKHLGTAKETPETRLALGLALEGLGEQADEIFARLRAETPELFGRMMDDVDRFIGLEHYQLAADALARARKIAPADAETSFQLGLRYYNISMKDEAVNAYRASIRKAPSMAAYGELAGVYEKSNQIKEAKAFAEFGVRNFPGEPRLIATLANCERRLGEEDKAEVRLNEALGGDIGDLSSKAEMLNVLGRIYDRRDNVADAYEAFQACKDTLKQTQEYKNSHIAFPLEVIEQLMALDLNTLPQHKGANGYAWTLVFFIGFPRSGTTLVEQILDSHPDVVTAEEKSILTAPLRILDKFESGYPASLTSLSPDHIEYLRKLYFLEMSQHARPGKGQVFVDKMPLNMIHVPAIKTLFPEAKIIFGLRHPCAVGLSCLIQNFALNGPMANMMNLNDITRFYAAAMGLWQKCTSKMEFPHHYVLYENIVDDLPGETRKLAEFLGVEWSPAMLDYRKSASDKGLINTPSYHQVVQPLYTKSVDRWRRYDKYFEPYRERLQPFLEAFDYA